MVDTWIQEGERLTFTTAANYTKGDVVVLNELVGVVLHTTTSGEENVLLVEGVHELAGNTPEAWTAGERLFWDTGGFWTNTSGAGRYPAGIAWADKASAAALGLVKLSGHISVAV